MKTGSPAEKSNHEIIILPPALLIGAPVDAPQARRPAPAFRLAVSAPDCDRLRVRHRDVDQEPLFTMKQITKYQAFDGKEFTSEVECENYEDFSNRVKEAMIGWPEEPKNDGCSFANGGGYIQIPKEILRCVRIRLLDLISEKCDHPWVKETYDESKHASWVGGLIGEMPYPELQKAWGRLCNIDTEGREWGQGYYAAHPNEGKQICLNP